MKHIACVFILCALWGTEAVRAQVSEREIGRKQLELGVFALKRGAESGANVTLSPYSIHAALMLLRLGAQGAIASEMDAKLLPAPFSSDVQNVYAALNAKVALSNEQVTSTLSNAVWLAAGSPFQRDYVTTSRRIFSSEPRNVDFREPDRARDTINAWVSSHTKSLIPKLLPAGVITERTTCVLVNALYFKSAWLSPFERDSTHEGDFWVGGATEVKVPMMSSSSSLGYFETDGWQAVHLPYRSFDFFLVVLVPKERRSIGDIAGGLSADLLARSFHESEFTQVKLSVPRFKVRFSTDLVEQLQKYGLSSLQYGDYSRISPRNVGSVGSVIHEAVVSVDEGGTEAAAATAVTMLKGMRLPDPSEVKTVTVDRPFAFALVHRPSLAPLFLGVVGDPR